MLRAAPTEYAAAFRSFVDNGSSHLFVFWYQIVHVSDSGVIHKLREQDFGCFWPLPSPWLFTFTTECEQFFEIFNPYPPSGCSRSLWMTPYTVYTRLHYLLRWINYLQRRSNFTSSHCFDTGIVDAYIYCKVSTHTGKHLKKVFNAIFALQVVIALRTYYCCYLFFSTVNILIWVF